MPLFMLLSRGWGKQILNDLFVINNNMAVYFIKLLRQVLLYHLEYFL